MSEICTDNRFEVIAAYKQKLMERTNIETSPDEMAVIDNVLFRFWQMGWLPRVPHGRLIDADALIIALETQDYSGAPDTLDDWTPMDMTKAEIADIKAAPTIIPAEEGET